MGSSTKQNLILILLDLLTIIRHVTTQIESLHQDIFSCLQKDQSTGQARSRVPQHSHHTEAEYKGVVNAATQCLWLQGILGECGFESKFSTIIYCDNQKTIQICNDLVQRQRTKHIEIHMHYIRQLVQDGTIDLLFCASSEQVAYIFTKVFF